jgi:hypothetical protein
MKNTVTRPRARGFSVLTIKFSAPEVRRIEKAAASCGFENAGPDWARRILMGNADAVLRSRKPASAV